jgi:two-component system heavy metal sensor histidine kinase CusS
MLWRQSISVRLALWYAAAASATLFCLFTAGYFMLEAQLIHGLDMLNKSEFGELRAHLVRDYRPDDPRFIEQRLRKPVERARQLFYVSIRDTRNGNTFRSTNLGDAQLYQVSHNVEYIVDAGPPGELRVGVFRIDPLVVTVATPVHAVHVQLRNYLRMCAVLLAGMMAASLVIGIVLSRAALRPIRLISDTATRIGSDNLDERIPVGAVRDEVSDLARMLNQMFDRLQASFNEVRRFSAEASHEVKTPLSLIRLHAEKMLRDGVTQQQEEALVVQLEEIARLDQIIEELLFLSRAEANAISLMLEELHPASFLQGFAQDAQVLCEHHGMRFAHTHDGEGRVSFDPKRIRQVLLNLLTNAIKASPAGAHITLRSVLEDGAWTLVMEDQGLGLPSHEHERIFQRFVRVQQHQGDDRGNGLGLAICRSIVTLHGGSIRARSGRSCGLEVVIDIPSACPA